jgi:hypothetical protein
MALGGTVRPWKPTETKMTKLQKMVGVAFVAMGLLTGFAVNTAHAGEVFSCQNDIAICDQEIERMLGDDLRL